MNITIHPCHGLHHYRLEQHHEHGKLYQLFHDENFWAFTILIAVFAVTLVFATVLVKDLQADYPPQPMYFP